MKTIDIIFSCLAGFCVISAVMTLITYILYNFFNIGFDYLSIVFFICAMIGAVLMMLFISLMPNKKLVER